MLRLEEERIERQQAQQAVPPALRPRQEPEKPAVTQPDRQTGRKHGPEPGGWEPPSM